MPAPILAIADALVLLLNQPAAPGHPLHAERVALPIADLSSLPGRKVLVVPAQDETERLVDRSGRWEEVFTIHVAIYQRVLSERIEHVDPLVHLADEIAAYLRGNPPPGPPYLRGCSLQTLFDPKTLRETNVFSTAITTTWAQLR